MQRFGSHGGCRVACGFSATDGSACRTNLWRHAAEYIQDKRRFFADIRDVGLYEVVGVVCLDVLACRGRDIVRAPLVRVNSRERCRARWPHFYR